MRMGMRQDLCIFSFLGTYFSPTTSSRASMLCAGGVGVGDLPLGVLSCAGKARKVNARRWKWKVERAEAKSEE